MLCRSLLGGLISSPRCLGVQLGWVGHWVCQTCACLYLLAGPLCSSPCPVGAGLGWLEQRGAAWELCCLHNLTTYGCLDFPHCVAVSAWLDFFPHILPRELSGSYEASYGLASEFPNVTSTRFYGSSKWLRPAHTITLQFSLHGHRRGLGTTV